jgi:hypothetical protein
MKPQGMSERAVSRQEMALARQVFNRLPKLSPTARRVGLELLDHVNVRTLRCDPGETRLALLLSVSVRAVRKAKKEIAGMDLISWEPHGGIRFTSSYKFKWAELRHHAEAIQRTADAAMRARRENRNNLDQTGTTAATEEERQFR